MWRVDMWKQGREDGVGRIERVSLTNIHYLV